MNTTLAEERFVLGLDVGTQSLRAALFDLQGRSVAFGVAPIDTTFPRPAWAEQDPAQWWSAARAAVQKALAQASAQADHLFAQLRVCFLNLERAFLDMFFQLIV